MIQSIGKFTPTVGTPLRVTSGEPNPALPLKVHGLLFQALPENTGRVYVGSETMNRPARTGLFAMVPAPSTGALPSFSTALTIAPNGINAADFYIDADTPGDGVVVTALIA